MKVQNYENLWTAIVIETQFCRLEMAPNRMHLDIFAVKKLNRWSGGADQRRERVETEEVH